MLKRALRLGLHPGEGKVGHGLGLNCSDPRPRAAARSPHWARGSPGLAPTLNGQNGKERVHEWENAFDVVITDVPCSGLGIIRKKPDIRYKDPKPLGSLPVIQKAILDNACAYVKPGGVLLYSTCTLLERENEAVVRKFIEEHDQFVLEKLELPGPVGVREEGYVTLWPHLHGTDGFFIAKLRRKA